MTTKKHDPIKNPFQHEVDNQTFYLYPSLSQRLHMTLRMLTGHSRLILILGDEGSGKTLLRAQVMAKDEPNWKVCRINAHDPTDAPCDQELHSMKQHMAFMFMGGELPIVMMDDAHRLSRAELSFLIRMTGAKGYQRQIDKLIFLGEPSLLNHLSEFKDMIPQTGAIEKVFMPKMTLAETGIYLDKRLASVGCGSSAFTMSERVQIHEASDGYPGKVNALAGPLYEKKSGQGKGLASVFKKFFPG